MIVHVSQALCRFYKTLNGLLTKYSSIVRTKQMQCLSEELIKKAKDPKVRKIVAIFAFVVAVGILVYDLVIYPKFVK